jgi:hypothetical protein
VNESCGAADATDELGAPLRGCTLSVVPVCEVAMFRVRTAVAALALTFVGQAQARDLTRCAVGGKLQAAVTRTLGQRAAKASYSVAIVRGTGELLCAEAHNGELSMSPASTIMSVRSLRTDSFLPSPYFAQP